MQKLLCAMMILSVAILPGLARAEEATQQRAQTRQRMEYLRKNDPEEYKKAMAQTRARRAYLDKQLSELKEKDPKRYQELMQKRQARREQWLEELKKNDPKGYERFIRNHPDWRSAVFLEREYSRPGPRARRGKL